MSDPRVILVMLRQPDRNAPNEMRTDPLWEFGSFGSTRCHQRNLMNPHRIDELVGCRLAFAQGGISEIRLVHVTPPVSVVHHGLFAEVKWEPVEMPLAFHSALILVDNHGFSDFPAVLDMIDKVARNTPVARFASKFRSRRKPLRCDIGREIVFKYRNFRRRDASIAKEYYDAMPYPPPRIDRDRQRTYEELLGSL